MAKAVLGEAVLVGKNSCNFGSRVRALVVSTHLLIAFLFVVSAHEKTHSIGFLLVPDLQAEMPGVWEQVLPFEIQD
jgi:hypothetical protein